MPLETDFITSGWAQTILTLLFVCIGGLLMFLLKSYDQRSRAQFAKSDKIMNSVRNEFKSLNEKTHQVWLKVVDIESRTCRNDEDIQRLFHFKDDTDNKIEMVKDQTKDKILEIQGELLEIKNKPN